MGWLKKLPVIDWLITRLEMWNSLEGQYPFIKAWREALAAAVLGGLSLIDGISLPVAVLIALVAAAAVRAIIYYSRRPGGTAAQPENANPAQTAEVAGRKSIDLYVGRMDISASSLNTECVCHVIVHLFNASPHHIAVLGIGGNVVLSFCSDGAVGNAISLPTPSMVTPSDRLSNIEPLAEVAFTIEQRFPKDIADSLAIQMPRYNSGYHPQLQFDKLNIMARSIGGPSGEARLPLWTSMEFYTRQDRLLIFQGKTVAEPPLVAF